MPFLSWICLHWGLRIFSRWCTIGENLSSRILLYKWSAILLIDVFYIYCRMMLSRHGNQLYIFWCHQFDVQSFKWPIFLKKKGMKGGVVSRVMEGATVSYQSCSGNVSDTTLLVKALDNMTFVKTSSLMEYIFIRTNNWCLIFGGTSCHFVCPSLSRSKLWWSFPTPWSNKLHICTKFACRKLDCW